MCLELVIDRRHPHRVVVHLFELGDLPEVDEAEAVAPEDLLNAGTEASAGSETKHPALRVMLERTTPYRVQKEEAN